MVRKKLADRLVAAGFNADDQAAEAYAADRVDLPNASHIHGVWRKGKVTVVVEENKTQGTPAVAVVEGPGGRAAVDPDDLDLIEAEAQHLSR